MNAVFPLSGLVFNINALPPLFTSLAILVLGLIVVIRERGSRVSLLYLSYTLAASAWMFCAAVALFMPSEALAFRWMKFANAGVTMIPAALYHFTVVVLGAERQRRRLVRLAWTASLVFLCTTLFSNVMFGGFNHYSWGIFLKYRWPSGFFVAYFFVMTVLSLRLYWSEYRRSERNTAKYRRARAFLLAFGIGCLGALDFLPAFGVSYYPMSSVPMLCMLILASRAIWRYRLEDITPAFAAQQIIETMNEALIVLDSEGIVRVVNRALCSLLACREQDILNRRPGEGLASCRELAEKLESLRNGAVRNIEVLCGPHTLILSSSIMRNAAGEHLATVCLVADITERKRSEESLRASEERLSRAQRMAHVGNWERNLKTGRVWWSEEIFRIYGVDPERFSPTSVAVEKAVHPGDLSRFLDSVRTAVVTGKPFELDYRLVRPDGLVRTVHSVGAAAYDGSGTAVSISGTMQDVTDQHLAEAERELLIARLRDANEKLQSLDRVKTNFITMVSHELRTPLTTIKAFVELILMKEGMQEHQKLKLMKTVNAEADRLARLIADLLDLARIESGAMKWQRDVFSVEELIRAALAVMSLLFEKKGLRVSTFFDPGLPCASGDRDRLMQVLTNILSNAAKFTPPGGEIRVSARQERVPKPRIVVEVADSGIGIASNELEPIFEKFHRSDDRRIAGIEGTGLGLAISREIIEYHGGRIWAASTYGKGSVFTFTIPVVSDLTKGQGSDRTVAEARIAGDGEA